MILFLNLNFYQIPGKFNILNDNRWSRSYSADSTTIHTKRLKFDNSNKAFTGPNPDLWPGYSNSINNNLNSIIIGSSSPLSSCYVFDKEPLSKNEIDTNLDELESLLTDIQETFT